MKTLLVWLCLCGFCAADNMFGLGEPEPTMAGVSVELFGMDTPVQTTHREVVIARDGVLPIRTTAAKMVAVAANVTERVLRPIIRRSTRNWTDPDVGNWTASNLREHLLGEFQSPQHRGSVPLSELNRSLSDLIAIHANLHEGWAWDGSSKVTATVRQTVVIPRQVVRYQSFQSTCPGGVCPTNGEQSFRLFRRR